MAGPIRTFLLRLVLEDAILREERAYRFYEQAGEIAARSETAGLLRKLCGEELRHRIRLEEMQSRGEAGELAVSDPEGAALLLEGPVPLPAIRPESTVREILEIALVKERQAHTLYRSLSEGSPLGTVWEVFRLLAQEEARHVRWVQRELESE